MGSPVAVVMCDFYVWFLGTQRWGQLVCLTDHLHPVEHWLAHLDMQPMALRCTLGMVLSEQFSGRHHLSPDCSLLSNQLDAGDTYSAMEFFDGGYWEQWCMGHINSCPFLMSTFSFSRYENTHTYTHTRTHKQTREYVTIPHHSSPKANSTSLHVKSGSRAECWL